MRVVMFCPVPLRFWSVRTVKKSVDWLTGNIVFGTCGDNMKHIGAQRVFAIPLQWFDDNV